MNYFSEEFQKDFLELLRRHFGMKRIHSNSVYNEYISFQEHTWMPFSGRLRRIFPSGWAEKVCAKWMRHQTAGIFSRETGPRNYPPAMGTREKEEAGPWRWRENCQFYWRTSEKGSGRKRTWGTRLDRIKQRKWWREMTFHLNRGACSSTATPSKSSSLEPSALKVIQTTAAVKQKESPQTSAPPREKKRKKSTLDEIMEMKEGKKRAAQTLLATASNHRENYNQKICWEIAWQKGHCEGSNWQIYSCCNDDWL